MDGGKRKRSPSRNCSNQPCLPGVERGKPQYADGDVARLPNRLRRSVKPAPPPPALNITTCTQHPQSSFFTRGDKGSPAFLPLLLLLSGDIETNPGPVTKGPVIKCPACNGFKWKQGGVICHQCGSWYRTIPKCSGVPYRTKPPPQWKCSKCQPPPIQPTTTTNPQPPTSPGPSGTQTPAQPPNTPTTSTQPTNTGQNMQNPAPQNRKQTQGNSQ